MKHIPKGVRTTLLFILSGLPLIVYPAVLMASVMSLAGGVSGEEPVYLVIIVYGFLIGSLLYPLVYIGSLIAYFIVKDIERKALFVKIPFLYLGFCIVLLILWVFAG
jgi:hypothetical protein